MLPQCAVQVGRGKKQAPKTILHSLSGAVHPGHLLAVMGPTGVSPAHCPSCPATALHALIAMPCIRLHHHIASFLLILPLLFIFWNRIHIDNDNDTDLPIVAIAYIITVHDSPSMDRKHATHATVSFSRV